MRKFISILVIAVSFNVNAVEFSSSTLSASSIAKMPEKIIVIANYQELPADIEDFDAQLLVINVMSMLEAKLNENPVAFTTKDEAILIAKDKFKEIEPEIKPLLAASLHAIQLVDEFKLKNLPAIIINDCFVSEQTNVETAIKNWERSEQCNTK